MTDTVETEKSVGCECFAFLFILFMPYKCKHFIFCNVLNMANFAD